MFDPQFGQPLLERSDDVPNRDSPAAERAEIPRLVDRLAREEPASDHEVAGERIQHMLPGTGGPRIADSEDLAAIGRANDVRDQPVLGPVAAADDVARPDARHPDVTREGLAPGVRHQLNAGLGGAIGVGAAELVGFAIAPIPFAVLVHLVGRRGNDRTHVRRRAAGLEQSQ